MNLIDGVVLTPLKQIFDERGKVMHMLRNDASVFKGFGEIYFSCTYPEVVKAWHLHKKMTLNYAVVHGNIKCVIYDSRVGSPTEGLVNEFYLSPENYCLLTVPPMVWNGWKGLGNETSIVANCATIPHDPNEIERLDYSSPKIPYNWNVVHR